MYDELVERLRASVDGRYEKCDGCPYEEDYPCCVDCLDKMHKQAADAIETMCEMVATAHGELANVILNYEESKPRWIPVEERLPEEMDQSCGEWSAEIRPSDDVLVWLSHEKRQSVAWYSHTYNEWTTVDENTVYCFGEVTHWMPLPEPPKEET